MSMQTAHYIFTSHLVIVSSHYFIVLEELPAFSPQTLGPFVAHDTSPL